MSVDTSKMIFVFGSNEGGIHGAGAARFAYRERGAVAGLGVGMAGQSYAIPTKGVMRLPRIGYVVGNTLRLNLIKAYVDDFIAYANQHPELQFQVTAIGCGLAGLKHEDIAPMFMFAPDNCLFDAAWMAWLGVEPYRYWGTF